MCRCEDRAFELGEDAFSLKCVRDIKHESDPGRDELLDLVVSTQKPIVIALAEKAVREVDRIGFVKVVDAIVGHLGGGFDQLRLEAMTRPNGFNHTYGFAECSLCDIIGLAVVAAILSAGDVVGPVVARAADLLNNTKKLSPAYRTACLVQSKAKTNHARDAFAMISKLWPSGVASMDEIVERTSDIKATVPAMLDVFSTSPEIADITNKVSDAMGGKN